MSIKQTSNKNIGQKQQVLCEYDGSNNFKRWYAYGEPAIHTGKGNDGLWLTADDVIGASSAQGNSYLFTGRRVDILDNGSLKIQYNRNRYYDYYTGRWLTHDPLGINPAAGRVNRFAIRQQYKGGLSLYQYVGSQPIMVTDALGTIASCPYNPPIGNPAFCEDTLDALHWPNRCWREVVPVGCGNSGNQCCYWLQTNLDPPPPLVWVFAEQSPDNSGPATGGGGGKCKYHWCNLCCHARDDVLGENPYSGPVPDPPEPPDPLE
ncbi:MAG TPA: RHS repeat-associated core domain-containing protein [Sedimentisphaerales bacterium]|nr:RHS repeat-associated core domain-containing protein [Sedimentisphaerales bacterium]